MIVIPTSEISFSDLSLADPLGRLFRWRGGLYRGIYEGSAKLVLELFESGLIGELVERRLFPASEVTELTAPGFSVVVRHEEIPVVTYPPEWTFDMLRDAALAVLEVVEISARYGWDIKDCSSYNVLFHQGRPVYVDLGSFRRAPRAGRFDKGPDLVRLFWRPLSIWSSGNAFLARRIIAGVHTPMPDQSWWHYSNAVLRRLNARGAAKAAQWTERVSRRLASLVRHGRALAWISPAVASWLPVDWIARSPELLRRKFARLRGPVGGAWENYQAEYLRNGEVVSTPRFDRLLDIIRSLDAGSAVELAGNQGVFSLLAARETQLRSIVSTDYADTAVNRLYHHVHAAAGDGRTLQPAVLDFMLPEVGSRLAAPAERFRADVVIALAVTHHLILTQGFPVRDILKTIAGYSRKYALIEFMPLGLWDGKRAPALPPWYTREWFREAFSEFFHITHEEQLEANRIVFAGRLRPAPLVVGGAAHFGPEKLPARLAVA